MSSVPCTATASPVAVRGILFWGVAMPIQSITVDVSNWTPKALDRLRELIADVEKELKEAQVKPLGFDDQYQKLQDWSRSWEHDVNKFLSSCNGDIPKGVAKILKQANHIVNGSTGWRTGIDVWVMPYIEAFSKYDESKNPPDFARCIDMMQEGRKGIINGIGEKNRQIILKALDARAMTIDEMLK